jgi:hypothetical protein
MPLINLGSCRSAELHMKCSCASNALSRFSYQLELLAFSTIATTMLSFLEMPFYLLVFFPNSIVQGLPSLKLQNEVKMND